MVLIELVSIHAPVGGATLNGVTSLACGKVSIHAPVGGATCDWYDYPRACDVSIHAPVGGATSTLSSLRHLMPFQSTRLWEARRIELVLRGMQLVVSIHAPVGGAT